MRTRDIVLPILIVAIPAVMLIASMFIGLSSSGGWHGE